MKAYSGENTPTCAGTIQPRIVRDSDNHDNQADGCGDRRDAIAAEIANGL